MGLPSGYRTPEEWLDAIIKGSPEKRIMQYEGEGRKIRVATPVGEVFVESSYELAKELEKVFKSRHIMGRDFTVVRTMDVVTAESPELRIEIWPPRVLLHSRKAGIAFMRPFKDLIGIVAGEEVITFKFKNPRQDFTIHPAIGEIYVGKVEI